MNDVMDKAEAALVVQKASELTITASSTPSESLARGQGGHKERPLTNVPGPSDYLLMDEKNGENKVSPSSQTKMAIIGIGMIIGFVMCFVSIENDPRINQTLAIAIWMATLWITEIIPLVVTAFLPLILFPLFGIVSSGDVASQYINDTIWLLISGFMLALTLERWNLHRRFSLKILTLCGTQPQFLLMGMMSATFFLSMFVSNTATALMMVPNAISVCSTLEDTGSPSYRYKGRNFATALLLGIAYAANVGGMASLIGTPSNLAFQRQLELLFPDAPEFTFADWIAFGLPIGLLMVAFIWAYLCFVYLRYFTKEDSHIEPDLFRRRYADLGPWTIEQKITATCFASVCLLWCFRADCSVGGFVIKGWSNLFPDPSYVTDATTGMTVAFIMFVCPARSTISAPLESVQKEYNASNGEFRDEEEPQLDANAGLSFDTTILDWQTANKMPYDVVFLLGGGFGLAKGFVDSGLSQYLGNQLAGLNMSLPALALVMITMIIWLTELTSNAATSNIMIPIAAAIAVAEQVSPYSLMIPATMACSCAFVLPIATPPNMVVFSTGRLPIREMNKAGVLLNVLSSLVLLGASFSIIPAVLGVSALELPAWAENTGF